MSQTLHLLKKDLRSLRLPLALLYTLVIAQTVLALQDPIDFDKARQIDGYLQLLTVLAMLVTTGMLVHQEPLVGTTAFWLTRPIRRSSLLTAKALFLLGSWLLLYLLRQWASRSSTAWSRIGCFPRWGPCSCRLWPC